MKTLSNDNFVILPNNAVQNLGSGEDKKSSFVQLYGKKSIAYLRNLLVLENKREQIYFSVDMILWMLGFENKRLDRERASLKDFLLLLHTNSHIKFPVEVDFKELKSHDYMLAKLNIYEYKVDDKTKESKLVNFFILLDSEYDTIMNYQGKLDKYNLLNLYCNIKSRVRRNGKDVSPSEREYEVAYPSYESIKYDIFIESDKTLKEYIDTLVELGLINYAYAGDMKMEVSGKYVYRKSNFTYVLASNPDWETDLEESVKEYKQTKRNEGWIFSSKEEEISANEKRATTQKINILEKKKVLTQSEKKELAKLKRKQEKWKREYVSEEDTRKLEEEKLLQDNPGKKLYEIYNDMGYTDKALRALRDAGYEGDDFELLDFLDDDRPEEESTDEWGEILDSFGSEDADDKLFEELFG